jgi:sugar lactone lactonase YvrE
VKSRFRFIAMAGVVACVLVTPTLSMADRDDGYGDDDIYIGNDTVNDIQRCDIHRGTCRTFVRSEAGGLGGPRAMIFRGSRLLVVNQNVNQNANGEVLRYDSRNGDSRSKLVDGQSPGSPYAPRGMVRGPGNVLYVAEFGIENSCADDGSILRYDASTGEPLKPMPALDFSGFKTDQIKNHGNTDFHPRGLVFGPDGYLYATLFGCPIKTDTQRYDPEAGYIVRFDPNTGKYLNTVASNKKDAPLLHRPEGMLFDRRGNIWVTSFRQDASNLRQIDVLLRIDRRSGKQTGWIPLGRSEYEDRDSYRTIAEDIVMGPGGDMFVPVTRGTTQLDKPGAPIDPKEGWMWRCSPDNGRCTVVVPAKRGMVYPWYAIFRDSDPATLEYNDD